ncbi:MAG TPA: hypothetical protein PKA42_00485 [Candidatus Paceibacterota bacterium]|nr:hypothetical protein [Candidatus Paceibacterota bacterium]HMO82622.1 hypothetical protein [Candidatus Paceibacterota bacterium]
MKNITAKEFTDALAKATPYLKELMGSDKIFNTVKAVLDNKQLKINPTDTLLPLGYYLLSLITLEEVLQEFTNLGITDQYNFLQEVKKNLMEDENNIATEFEDTEKSLESLENIRTMASDQQSNTPQNDSTYPSLQADILTNKNAVPPAKPPRWGTEN